MRLELVGLGMVLVGMLAGCLTAQVQRAGERGPRALRPMRWVLGGRGRGRG